MKTRSWLRYMFVALLLAALAVVQFPKGAFAADFHVTVGEVSVARGETHTGNLTANVGVVTVDGHVTGEVRNNLGSIVIRGTVAQDATSNVGEIRIERDAQVAGDVRTSVGEITVRGDVGGNVTSSAGEIRISGRVGGDVEQDAGEVRIDGEVAGNVHVRQGVVYLQPGAVVKGTVYVEEGWVSQGTDVSVNRIVIDRETRDFNIRIGRFARDWGSNWREFEPLRSFGSAFFLGPGLAMGLMFTFFLRTVFLVLYGLAALALFPERMSRMADKVATQPFQSFGIGLLGLMLTPLLIILLIISILGIITLPFVVTGIILLGLLGSPVAALALGRALAERFLAPGQPRWNDFAHLGLGLVVLMVLTLVPYFGSFLSFIVMVSGFGAILLSRFGRAQANGQPPASL